MSENTELLQFVHKNVEMGRETIPKVKELVEEPEFRRALDGQLEEYNKIAAQTEAAICRRGAEPQEPGQLSEAMSSLMLRMKTLADPSPSHIAEMMIQGSTMGVVQMTRRIHELKDRGDREAVDLACRLLKTEENNIKQLKSFL